MSVELVLLGYFTGFDKYGRLLFKQETCKRGKKDMKKLWTLQNEINGRSPITTKGFWVTLGGLKKDQIQKRECLTKFIGIHCRIRVLVKKYDFTNDEKQQMQGFTLILRNISDIGIANE